MLEMDANLMSSTTVQPALNKARLSPPAHDFEIGSRHAPAFARNRHLLAMNAMTCNRRDDASGSAPQFPGNKREVDLVNRARRELPREVDVRKIILRDHETTARFFIQSMNNARSLLPADTRKIFAMRQQSVSQGAAFAAGTRVNRNPRGFVYHDEIVVFKQHRERDLFRDQIDRFHRRLDQSNAVACSDHIARTRNAAVYPYVTLPNKCLDSRTRKFPGRFREKTIHSRPGIRCRNDEFAAVFLRH